MENYQIISDDFGVVGRVNGYDLLVLSREWGNDP